MYEICLEGKKGKVQVQVTHFVFKDPVPYNLSHADEYHRRYLTKFIHQLRPATGFIDAKDTVSLIN